MATFDPTHSYEFDLNDTLSRDAADLGDLAIAGGTVLCHARPTTVGRTNLIAGQWTASNRSWVLFYTGIEALSFYWSPDGSSVNSHSIQAGGGSDTSPAHDAVEVDEWRFVGATFTTGAGNNQLYTDGTTLGAGGTGGTLYGSSSGAPLRVGSSDALAEDYLGQIFNLMIWDTVLSGAQILAQMTQFKPVTFTGLQGWWPMLSSTGPRDMSGNAKDFELVNTPTLVEQVPSYVLGIEQASAGIGSPPYSGVNIAAEDV